MNFETMFNSLMDTLSTTLPTLLAAVGVIASLAYLAGQVKSTDVSTRAFFHEAIR